MEFVSFSSVLFITSLLLVLISFIVSHVFRVNKDDDSSKKEVNNKVSMTKEISDSKNWNHDTSEDKEESSGFTFKFQYQLSNQLDTTTREEIRSPPAANIHKYQFVADKDVVRFAEEPELQVLHLEEFCSSEKEDNQLDISASLLKDSSSGAEVVTEKVDQKSLTADSDTPLNENLEEEISSDDDVREIERQTFARFLSNELSSLNSDSDSVSGSDGYSVKDLLVDSDSMFSDEDVDELEHQSVTSEESTTSSTYKLVLQECRDSEETELQHFCHSDREYSTGEQLREVIERQNMQESSVTNEEQIELSEQLQSNLDGHEAQLDEINERAERSEISDNLKSISDEDDEDDDSLWEHEDILEQLKQEIKRNRTNGLPTILEESESPKSDDDLKPWKMDKKFLREDPIDELHKFYKSYIERMKKLDILNYQKMYAIGFLQLKDPLELLGSQMFCIPSITSIMSQNCPLRRGSTTAPSENFVKELRCDLEFVYVAQMCISWEFLRWQYEKARELPETGSRGNHHYNQVAGEFQKFQVVLQRFVENEAFQGPRLQNYVKNRFVLRNLLQVPVVKVDSSRDKKAEQQKDNFIITIEMLEDIMEESIRVFWEFVKADKDETPLFLKGLMRTNTELQDASDYELLSDIKSDLQKKEKKLGDILRTGNCLIKKFKKPKEDRSNEDVFFTQIDLKLVARVLRMPRITSEQLVWCQEKLSKIVIVERKIHREASFSLFPC